MKKRILTLLLAMIMLLSLASPAFADTYRIEWTLYDDGSAEFNGHTYEMIDQYAYWQEAEDYCESKGGHLVTITSREEQRFIQRYLEKMEADDDFLIGLRPGLNDRIAWVTGESVTYTNWGEGHDVPRNYPCGV